MAVIRLSCGCHNTMKEFTITKQVSKQGTNSIIVIPKFLQGDIKPRDVVELRIKVLRSGGET